MATHSLQYSFLENTMDRGGWQVTVHRVACLSVVWVCVCSVCVVWCVLSVGGYMCMCVHLWCVVCVYLCVCVCVCVCVCTTRSTFSRTVETRFYLGSEKYNKGHFLKHQ